MNQAQPVAEAVAVKDGKILAVGTRAAIEQAHNGADTRIVDLAGKTLLPGFIDPHSHYINALSMADQVNVFAPPAGPGKLADLVILDRNPLTVEPMAIKDIKVVETIKEGKTIYPAI